MAGSLVGMIAEIRHEVETATSKQVSEQVMAGAEGITAKTGASETALWVKGVMERLDAQTPGETAAAIMSACGRNCAQINHGVIERAKKRRSKFKSEEDFLAAELHKPQAGTRLERDGNVLYQYYTPKNFKRPMRCYCGLMRGLPGETQVSLTYCQCSRAFVETLWSAALDRPVTVQLLSSVINGSEACTFKIMFE